MVPSHKTGPPQQVVPGFRVYGVSFLFYKLHRHEVWEAALCLITHPLWSLFLYFRAQDLGQFPP